MLALSRVALVAYRPRGRARFCLICTVPDCSFHEGAGKKVRHADGHKVHVASVVQSFQPQKLYSLFFTA
eukprot:600951-Pleurochrysis_carterae.AAC.1